MTYLRNILAAFSLALCGTALAVEIQDLTELAAAPASGDLLIIVDVSDSTDDAAGTGKKITTANLAGYMYGTAGTFTAAQTAQITDAGTTTVVYPLIVDHQSSGTPAAGQGVGVAFNVETAAGNTETGATISVVATDVTAASEDFEIDFSTMVAGAAPATKVRLSGTQVLQYSNGTAALPAYAFDIGGNRAYGLYYSSGTVITSINGTASLTVGSGGITSVASVAGNAASPGVIYGFKTFRFDLSSSTTLSSGSYNGATLTNSTAGAGITSTLVTAAQGWNHRFVDDNATYRWTIKPNSSDTIIWTDGTVVTAATGSIVSTARYDSFDVEALDATVWLARDVRGTWTVTP